MIFNVFYNFVVFILKYSIHKKVYCLHINNTLEYSFFVSYCNALLKN